MAAYKIAERFTLEARRRACEAVYEVKAPGCSPRARHDEHHYWCPLGVCMGTVPLPTSGDVANYFGLEYSLSGDIAWYAVAADADRFIVDWDAGRIVDLWDALGVSHE